MASTITRILRHSLSLVPKRSVFFSVWGWLFFFGTLSGIAQTPPPAEPTFSYLKSVFLGIASAADKDNIVIAVDTDAQGNVYALTFGAKIMIYSKTGERLPGIILPDDIESPVDMAINSQNEIYVAGFEDRKVFAFDLFGDPLPDKNIETSWFKPLGIAFDKDDNLYVVEYNDGTGAESDKSSRLNIYYENGTSDKNLLTNQLKVPFRIAVNSSGTIFISHAGENDKGEVKVFDANLNYLETLDVVSPGSIEIDENDFVYVIDYNGRFNFQDFLNYSELKFFEFFDLIVKINEGIEKEEFGIQIYTPERSYLKTLNDELDLPIDLAFFDCSKLFVIDSDITDDLKLEFELDIFDRISGCDEPPTNSAPVGKLDEYETQVNTTLSISQTGVLENDTDPEGDALSAVLGTDVSHGELTLNPDGSFEYIPNTDYVGEDSFTYVANDGELDSDPVTVTITVTAAPNTAPQAIADSYSTQTNTTLSISQTGVLENDTDPEGDVLTAVLGTDVFHGDLTLNADGSFEYIPNTDYVGEDSFTYVATDGELDSDPVTVTIAVTEVPNTAPQAIADSYSTQTNTTLNKSQPGVLENDTDPEGDALSAVLKTDVAHGELTLNADGSFEYIPNTDYIGEDSFTYVANDGELDSEVVTVTIAVTEETPLQISCPENQTEILDEACGFKIPDYTKEATVNFPEAKITQSVRVGEIISKKTTEITLTATLNRQTDTCSFNLTLIDNISPEITCPGNQTENYDPQTGFILPDYTGLATFNDNCEVVRVEQFPVAGTKIDKNTEITITITDGYGNSVSCDFMVLLTEDEVLEITCPGNQTGNLDKNCQFEVPDYTNNAEVNFEGATITQSPAPGTLVSENTSITLTATWENSTDACSFQLNLEDTTAPVAKCSSGITLKLDGNGVAALSAQMINNGSTDNCGIATIEINKTLFTEDDLGENFVTLTITDTAGNTSMCETTVTVTPHEQATGITCVARVELELGEDGTASLEISSLFTGNGEGYEFSVSKNSFNCSNLGSNSVVFNYSKGEEEGACTIEIVVTDPQGYCEDDPTNPNPPLPPGLETYFIVYPNPGHGIVNVLTSADIQLNKVFVFDVKGQLLFMKTLSGSQNGRYSVDLRGLQSAVYLLQFHSDEKIYLERVIISAQN